MRKYLAIALLSTLAILAMCSCGAYKRKILATCPTVTEAASTTTSTTSIDTIVLPADSALYKALIECQNGKPVLVGEWIDNGIRLDVSSYFTPGEAIPTATTGHRGSLVIKALQPQAKVVTPKTVTQTNTTYKKEALQVCPGLTGWQWFQIWIGRIAMLLLLIYIILKIVKRFL